MAEWMSLRAYSRRRGDRLYSVQMAIQSGRVSAAAVRRDESGRLVAIDAELADQEWARNTDPAEALRNGKWPAALLEASPAAPVDAAPAVEPAPAVAAVVGESQDYLAARTREKQFQAKRAELDYLERVGTLVSADEVREEQIQIYREMRDALELIPARTAQRIAAETDPQRIEHVLLTEVRKVLSELSRAFAGDDAVAAGTGERALAPA